MEKEKKKREREREREDGRRLNANLCGLEIFLGVKNVGARNGLGTVA